MVKLLKGQTVPARYDLTNRLIALGNRQYKREYQCTHTGEVVKCEYLLLKSGRFVFHNLFGPAIEDFDTGKRRWYKNGKKFPYWVPIVYKDKVIAFEDESQTTEAQVDKALILRTTLEFDRDWGQFINEQFNKQRKHE